MTANKRQLDIWSNEFLVGVLREVNGIWELEYDQAWVKSATSFGLSPALPRDIPRRRDGASQRPVQWYFDNLLPEETLRDVLAKEANIAAEDAFGLLAHFGSESAGSLVLLASGQTTKPEQGLKPLSMEELSRRIRELPRSSLTRDAPKRMSLAGAQHKMVIVMRDNALYEPLPGTPSTHILKPNHPSDDYRASVMNEFFIMSLAKEVGLDVPDVRRMYVPEPVYVVERFDRKTHEDGSQPNRLHMVDTCQLLNKPRAFKYAAATLETLAESISVCRAKAAARMQLYRWALFNVMVGNGDNHLKNISYKVSASGIDIAPAYDLLSTSVYATKAFANERAIWPHVELALPIGEAKRFADVTKEDLLLAGSILGLTPQTAERELERMMSTIEARASALVERIDRSLEDEISKNKNSDEIRLSVAADRHVLRSIVHIVIRDMAEILSAKKQNKCRAPLEQKSPPSPSDPARGEPSPGVPAITKDKIAERVKTFKQAKASIASPPTPTKKK